MKRAVPLALLGLTPIGASAAPVVETFLAFDYAISVEDGFGGDGLDSEGPEHWDPGPIASAELTSIGTFGSIRPSEVWAGLVSIDASEPVSIVHLPGRYSGLASELEITTLRITFEGDVGVVPIDGYDFIWATPTRIEAIGTLVVGDDDQRDFALDWTGASRVVGTKVDGDWPHLEFVDSRNFALDPFFRYDGLRYHPTLSVGWGAVIPEPASAALLAAGLVGLALLGKKS